MDYRWPGSCLYCPDDVIPRVRLAEAVTSLTDDIPFVHEDYLSPMDTLRFIMDSSVLVEGELQANSISMRMTSGN